MLFGSASINRTASLLFCFVGEGEAFATNMALFLLKLLAQCQNAGTTTTLPLDPQKPTSWMPAKILVPGSKRARCIPVVATMSAFLSALLTVTADCLS